MQFGIWYSIDVNDASQFLLMPVILLIISYNRTLVISYDRTLAIISYY